MKIILLKKKSIPKDVFRKAFFLLCFAFCISSYTNAQSEVSGIITDVSEEPMIGVTIRLKNGTQGTVTDMDGRYSISVPGNGTLEITYMGYKKQEIAVQSKRIINVVLEEDTQLLDEVIVVGYTSIRKESLTGALQVVSNEKLLDSSTPNVENLLSGKAPGVQVNLGSGQPGEAGKIVIRGKSTLNGSTDPLWVIDGVIMGTSANDLNPVDIENITILKDAASTAVYGSQGANGVILVTTKRGEIGKMRVSASAKFVISELNNGNFEVMDGAELYDYYNSFQNKEALGSNSWWNPDLRNKNYSWWDNAVKTGFAQDYNVSISGGNENLRSYMSLGMYDETGVVKGFDFKRYNVLLKMEYKPTKWLTIRPQINGSRRNVDDREHSLTAMYGNLPWDSPYNDKGELVKNGKSSDANWIKTAGTNYLYDLQWNFTKVERYEIAGNFDFDIKIKDWLTFASVNNYKFSKSNRTQYVDPRSNDGESANGRITETFFSYDRLYTNQLLRVNKAFGDHYINGVIGYEWNEFQSKYNESMAVGFAPGFEVQGVAVNQEKVTGNRRQSAVQSYLSNINYSYDDRYMVQFSLRRDGASNFGTNAKYGNFYSLSGGWNIHNEKFFTVKEISNLKLRASYGTVGNRPTEPYPFYSLYGTGIDYSYNGKPGALVTQMGNPDLTWEKSKVLGLGLDVSFWDSRARLILDYYKKNTSDLLYEVNLPGVTGFNKIMMNTGEVENQGFEASIGVDIFKAKDFSWTVEANIGINRNKVVSLYNKSGSATDGQMLVEADNNLVGGAQKIFKPGLDADTWYLKEWAGVDPTTGAAMWYRTEANGERVTTTEYDKANSVPISRYTPDFFGGFSTNLKYKDFDLAAVFSYSVGGHIYNYARSEFDSDGAYTDRNQAKLHSNWSRWEKEGDIATHPVAIYNNPNNTHRVSSRFLETGTYLKLKSLTVGYTIPLKFKGISNLRAYAAGENLFTITHFSGVDPEIPPRYNWSGGESVGTITGVARFTYPKTTKFVLGINVSL